MKKEVSIIITSYKEPATIQKAIERIAEQKIANSEIIVIAPDKETLDSAGELKKRYKYLRVLKDEGKGKSAALNHAVEESNGKILILTDGDVFVSNNSLKALLDRMKDDKIGAVTGRPVSTNEMKNKYGYWAYLLTQIAHTRRERAVRLRRRFFCSGYLFAIRKELFPKLHEGLLSEDGFISHRVYQQGYRIAYEGNAIAYVKYPDNFKDWIIQKKRSAGGYNQLKKMLGIEIRSFKTESLGFLDFFKYVSNLRKLIWLGNLFLARLYLWTVIYRDVNFKKKSREELWKRVESTKQV